jgi:hypothetical protein
MEKLLGTVLSVFLFTSLGYAVIIESGDAGAAFAADMSVEQCKSPDVEGVYLCNGNVVKVVSLIPGEGSTFYKPDGGVEYCPVVAPADMGAECTRYFMQPNICSSKNVCTPPPPNATDDDLDVLPDDEKKDTGVGGIPDIEPDMSVPERIEPPEEGGALSQEVFILAVIIIGMVAVALINYVYFKTKGT